MNSMWKINGVSVLYAFSLFIQVELLINVYRLERVIGITNMNRYVPIPILIIFILTSILAYFLTKFQLNHKKIKYMTTVLWIPYFLIFIKLFAYYYPITNPQEMPLPGIGLVIIVASCLYPLYIALLTFCASLKARGPL
ncbi:hypothetical protein MJ257_14840 [Paenibacillus timonensis]|uniref:Uncharacterized protein n=1 Tax=Paenibacillus timonensis TaxID=225915 RepID=A0ABW3SEM9_9BACL|nr:hypothetical protein [Paenibacillus timonensis]MCH1641387.1 hypothetical protein [Paenibacillus timonensis]